MIVSCTAIDKFTKNIKNKKTSVWHDIKKKKKILDHHYNLMGSSEDYAAPKFCQNRFLTFSVIKTINQQTWMKT